MITESKLLVFYDSKKPFRLSCDSSAYGVGAVISHVMKDGSERPIPFASRTLSETERRRNELTLEKGLLLWGMRVVIPDKFRGRLLLELHDEHLGTSRTKALARGYLWWPYLDRDIEDMVERCSACASTRNTPKESPLHPWIWASRPGQRVHIDYTEYKGQSFLVIIDSFSKWLKVMQVKSTTSSNTIEKLRTWFASVGIPEEIVSDNGPKFTSCEFQDFMKHSGVKHTLVPPYHPQSNGLAERGVQILKKSMKEARF
ncbi:uncharacterized protein K02A2.6-like [Saccostrea cucullata]|uniref:uncharacterized protein K02A2.6-like n=1 Tax=Saccostrea cuccullata TaxID=36930 RepID=UPI002ED37DE1